MGCWSRAVREDVRMDEELSAELLERARRDQAARKLLRPGHGMPEWETVVAPVDRDNAVRLREIVGQHGWPGHRLAGEAGNLTALAFSPNGHIVAGAPITGDTLALWTLP